MSAEPCDGQSACGSEAVCDSAVGRCRPGRQGASKLSFSTMDPRPGDDVTLQVPPEYLERDVVITVRGPSGAWVTPVVLEPGEAGGAGRVLGIPAVRAGTYYVEVARNQVTEHASNCGDNKNNAKLDELDLVESRYLVVN